MRGPRQKPGHFLSIKKGKQLKQLEELKDFEATLVFYESPHRILKLLENISQIFPICVVCAAPAVDHTPNSLEDSVEGPLPHRLRQNRITICWYVLGVILCSWVHASRRPN